MTIDLTVAELQIIRDALGAAYRHALCSPGQRLKIERVLFKMNFAEPTK